MIRLTATKAKRMGQEVAQYGLPADSNPFPHDHKYHSVWLDGWHNPDVTTIQLESGTKVDYFEGEM